MKKILSLILAAALLICAFPVAAFAVTDDVPVCALQYEIKITDNFGWGKAYVYAWDENNNDIFGAYPGLKIDVYGTNDYGENFFLITLPQNTEGFILADENNKHTVDITDFQNYDGYWLDGSTDENGRYNVIGYSDNPVDYTVPDWKETFYCFYNSLGFEDVYMYAYDNSGNPLIGEWPGTALTYDVVEDGLERYVLNIPDGAKGYVIHDNKGNQTEDIEDFSLYRFWLDGTMDDMGHYLVTPFSIPPVDPSSPTTPSTQPESTEPDYTYRIDFVNTLDWEDFYVYAWNENGNAILGDWPGTKLPKEDYLSDYGHKGYIFYLPLGTNGFIVNNGKGEQSEDITDLNPEFFYYLTDEKNDLGHYLVDTPHGVIATDEPTTAQNEDDTHYVHLTNAQKWDKVYLYSWDKDGCDLSNTWPGNEAVNKYINGYGAEVYVFEVPDNAAGMVFNNGEGLQSEDVLDTWKIGYWITDETDDMGNYIVGTFYDGTDPTSGTVPSPGEMRRKGDTNGDGIVSVADATLVQQLAAEMIKLEGEAISAADINGNGIVSVADATLIQQFAAEIITEL